MAAQDIDDVGFINAVVNEISANVGVDANRVYAPASATAA